MPPPPRQNQVSLASPGTRSIQEVHLGQVVFSALIQPSLLTCSDRQIHPRCPRTNEPIHPRRNPPDSAVSVSVSAALKPRPGAQGSGEMSGPAILSLLQCHVRRQSRAPSDRLPSLSPTGRVTGGEARNRGEVEGASARRQEHGMQVPTPWMAPLDRPRRDC